MSDNTKDIEVLFQELQEELTTAGKKVAELRTKNNAMCVVEALKKLEEAEFWASRAIRHEKLAK